MIATIERRATPMRERYVYAVDQATGLLSFDDDDTDDNVAMLAFAKRERAEGDFISGSEHSRLLKQLISESHSQKTSS